MRNIDEGERERERNKCTNRTKDGNSKAVPDKMEVFKSNRRYFNSQPCPDEVLSLQQDSVLQNTSSRTSLLRPTGAGRFVRFSS